ncbi:transmembrane emp24 domain-containing protein 5-like [Choristoneura fumiferana]|uniref:transmembrane emp24 domain-containing protein 5-like n=1 Tax=Choristoneura fumiferana TaxID=7141 RepID=UPI003D15D0E1
MRYIFVTFIFSAVFAYERDLTFTVQAGRTDCLYQHVKLDEIISVEYQVIDATRGELDISFQLADPVGRVLVADYKKPEASHEHAAALDGDYRFCFDNTFSTFSTKTVFLDLLTRNKDLPDDDYDNDKEMELGNSAETYMMKVRDIAESVSRVRDNVGAARRLQELVSAHEARDRNVAEETCARVMTWSMWQIVFMIGVGVTQVIFVRSLFEERNSRSFRKYMQSFVSQ